MRNHHVAAPEAMKIAVRSAAKAKSHRDRRERGEGAPSSWISGALTTKASVKAMATAVVARTTSLSSPVLSLWNKGLVITCPREGSCREGRAPLALQTRRQGEGSDCVVPLQRRGAAGEKKGRSNRASQDARWFTNELRDWPWTDTDDRII